MKKYQIFLEWRNRGEKHGQPPFIISMNKTSFVVNPTITTTYVLTATNSAGTVIQPVAVIVTADPAPTTITKDYQYDANGNITNDGVNIYVYDYNNRLISATNPSSPAGSSGPTAYAYDPSGQRIKVATATTTTIYPTQFYNSASSLPAGNTTITKHIFANNVDIATVQGSGAAAKVYYATTDSLNSSTIMTDSTGTIAETMDYFPFGEIRLDTHPSTSSGSSAFSEQKKYIGQEYDPDTGLNYLNARYYNSTLARFISQDPMSWNFDQAWLSDPQAQNAYSYGRNNPLIYADSDGKRAELIVKMIGNIPGAHGFINIIPVSGEDLSQYNVGNSGNGSHYTIGGYPSMSISGFGNLQAQINNFGDLNTPMSKYLATYQLAVPEGMSVAQYDKKLLESGYALSQQNLGPYDPFGRPLTISANSGNVATQVVINSGGIFPQTQNFYKDSNGRSYFAPGLGSSINTLQFALAYTAQTISYAQEKISQMSATISWGVANSISGTISRISSILNKLESK